MVERVTITFTEAEIGAIVAEKLKMEGKLIGVFVERREVSEVDITWEKESAKV